MTARELYVLPDDSSESTFQNDDSLPSLPVPSLEATLSKYLESVKPFVTAAELENTSKILEEFQNGEGQILHQKLVERAATSKNWVSYLFIYL